jgi:prepilin peptidase CpaA
VIFAVTGLSAVAAFTDFRSGRIRNWLTLPGAVLGLAYHGIALGWPGLGSAALGLVAGLALLIWMYFMGSMGAGDVKFLGALGAWMGPAPVAETALLGILFGGIFAVGSLIRRRRLGDFLSRLFVFVSGLFVREMKAAPMVIDRAHRMPFGIPLAAAAVCTVWFEPIGRLGWLGN